MLELLRDRAYRILALIEEDGVVWFGLLWLRLSQALADLIPELPKNRNDSVSARPGLSGSTVFPTRMDFDPKHLIRQTGLSPSLAETDLFQFFRYVLSSKPQGINPCGAATQGWILLNSPL